jgi:hypothetical protein
MPPKLDAEFTYQTNPRIPLRLAARSGQASVLVYAFIDTGADRSLFDLRILYDLNATEGPIDRGSFGGAGGGRLDVDFYDVELSLLDRRELGVSLPIAFAVGVERSVGNLIGLDVLEHFDFALSHRDRLGYLGRR